MSLESYRTNDQAIRDVAGKGTSLKFSDVDDIDTGFIKIGEVKGRRKSVKMKHGEKSIKPEVTVIMTPKGVVTSLPGDERQITSLTIYEASKLLPEDLVNEIKNDLKKERNRRKENIGAR